MLAWLGRLLLGHPRDGLCACPDCRWRVDALLSRLRSLEHRVTVLRTVGDQLAAACPDVETRAKWGWVRDGGDPTVPGGGPAGA